MKPTFLIEELQLKDNSEAEQVRLRRNFEVIKKRAIKEEHLFEYEKNFFCNCLRLSLKDDGTWEDYVCCENYKFRFLYLCYSHDLDGGSSYEKPKKNGTETYFASPDEVRTDIEFLNRKATEWIEIIQKNHSDELLQREVTEARQELKKVDEEFQDVITFGGRNQWDSKRKATILHSKYVFVFALTMFQIAGFNNIIKLDNEKIVLDEESFIHIAHRHYSKSTKQYYSNKSFHNEDFLPWRLFENLKQIIVEIDKSKLLSLNNIGQVSFKFKGENYSIWIKEKTKGVKGQGNITFKQLSTFYPVERLEEESRLEKDYKIEWINEDLSVYVPL